MDLQFWSDIYSTYRNKYMSNSCGIALNIITIYIAVF